MDPEILDGGNVLSASLVLLLCPIDRLDGVGIESL
jgi:hypothetical protein